MASARRPPSLRGEELLEPVDDADAALIDAVFAHYRACLWDSDSARAALKELGVSEEVARRFGVGLADRSLGLRLPERTRARGRALREQLERLGIYRSSGHEHFRGSLVVPVTAAAPSGAAGPVVGLYGLRLDHRAGAVEQWAAPLPGGLFNAGALDATNAADLLLVSSPIDALAVVSAGHEEVVAPGRPGGIVRADLDVLARSERRIVIAGEVPGASLERLADAGIPGVLIAIGQPIHTVLAQAANPSAALRALLDTVTEHKASPVTAPQSAAATPVGADTEAEDVPANRVTGDVAELHIALGARRWRVRGADRVKGPDAMRVAVSVTDVASGRFHLDTLDLYQAKVFFAWMARRGHIPLDPAAGLEMPRPEHRLPGAILSIDEVEAVLAGPDVTTPLGLRDRAVLEIFYSTAIRRAELIKLALSDIDYGRATLFVRQGKGKKDRLVPVGGRALDWTRRYVDEVRPQLVAKTGDRGVLFLSALGRPICADWLTRTVHAYVAVGAPTKRGSCHLFRHSAATHMLEGGADIRYVAELLGHAKLETTQIYTRVSIEKLRAVHAATHPTGGKVKPRVVVLDEVAERRARKRRS